AADCVTHERRARALSAVMAGGMFAGVLGPQLVTYTMDLWQPYLFAVTYLVQGAVALLSMGVLVGIRIPRPVATERDGGRPLKLMACQMRFMAKLICAVASYMMMNMVMTSSPIAMKLSGLPLTAMNHNRQ